MALVALFRSFLFVVYDAALRSAVPLALPPLVSSAVIVFTLRILFGSTSNGIFIARPRFPIERNRGRVQFPTAKSPRQIKTTNGAANLFILRVIYGSFGTGNAPVFSALERKGFQFRFRQKKMFFYSLRFLGSTRKTHVIPSSGGCET